MRPNIALPPDGWTLAPPGETVSPATGRDVWRLLLGALTVVVLANFAALCLLAAHNPNRGNWLVAQKAALAATGPAADTLLIGDSTCNQGLRPRGFDAALGGTTLNLCAIGTLGLIGDVVLLDRYLASHPAPKRIIVSHAPDVWFRQPNAFNLGLLPADATATADLQAAGLGGLGARAKMLAGRWLPLYAATRSLTDFIRHPLSTWARTYTLEPGGFMVVDTSNPAQKERDMREMAALLKANVDAQAALPTSTVVALKLLAERSRTAGFKLYLLPSAVAEPVARGADFEAYTARLLAAVEAVVETPWLSRTFRAFPADAMEESDHLLVAAADVFTAEVAAAVRRVEGGDQR